MSRRFAAMGAVVVGLLVTASCTSTTGRATVTTAPNEVHATSFLALRDPDVPDLPFDDNPDPDQCGIPVRWGLHEPAWLTGVWEGRLIQPEVLLYDSHVRLSITGRVEHGAEVRIVLFQENPVLDYYLVESPDGAVEGWVPEPFLSFERPST